MNNIWTKRSLPLVILAVIGALLVTACYTNPLTGRRQLKLLPESQLIQLALAEYQGFLAENRLSRNTTNVNLVKSIGNNIQRATEQVYRQQNRMSEIQNYNWEINLVDSDVVNAWAMPGGKIVVYDDLLPIAENTDGLAVVMGHEVAHVLLHHGNERMSQALAAQLGGVALDVALANKPQQTRALFQTAYGLGAQVGVILPFSRKQEREADDVGLFLMTVAGYNPEAGARLWQRMGQNSGGARPPVFLSTHPDPESRMNHLRQIVPATRREASKYGQSRRQPTQTFGR